MTQKFIIKSCIILLSYPRSVIKKIKMIYIFVDCHSKHWSHIKFDIIEMSHDTAMTKKKKKKYYISNKALISPLMKLWSLWRTQGYRFSGFTQFWGHSVPEKFKNLTRAHAGEHQKKHQKSTSSPYSRPWAL